MSADFYLKSKYFYTRLPTSRQIGQLCGFNPA